MRKRLVSLFLTFCVLLTLFPAFVAEADFGAAEENAVLSEAPESAVPDGMPDSDALLQAANISWSVKGGRLLFDGTTGTITGYTGELAELEIPSDIYGVAVTKIGAEAFARCGTLTSVIIPESVTSIDGGESVGAFAYCRQLTSVTIPDTVTYIGNKCFMGCSSLKTIALPKNITAISEALFFNCTALTDIEIPESVTRIYKSAFSGCIELSNVDFPSNLTAIYERAFEGCAKLSNPDFPNSVTSIGSYAFWNCASLTSVVIPERMTHIYEGAFSSCGNLKRLVIPQSVTSIPRAAFSQCPLTDIYYYGSIAQWLTITVEDYNQSLVNAELHFVTASYTITFHPNDGEVSPKKKILTDADTVYGELPTPTRDGYDFIGWHTATDYGDKITPETNFEPKQDQTLYAVWIKTHNVTLEANGGSVEPKSVTVEAGGAYGELPAPVRKGCDFLGWFTEPIGGTQITPETEVSLSGDQTLYAHWTATNVPEISDAGETVTDVKEISTDTDRELDGSLFVPDAADPEAFRTATAFCAVYDADGLMVHLQTWEIDVSDPRNIRFMGNVRIPAGVEVSEIKIMVLSDELTPLQAAGAL